MGHCFVCSGVLCCIMHAPRCWTVHMRQSPTLKNKNCSVMVKWWPSCSRQVCVSVCVGGVYSWFLHILIQTGKEMWSVQCVQVSAYILLWNNPLVQYCCWSYRRHRSCDLSLTQSTCVHLPVKMKQVAATFKWQASESSHMKADFFMWWCVWLYLFVILARWEIFKDPQPSVNPLSVCVCGCGVPSQCGSLSFSITGMLHN